MTIRNRRWLIAERPLGRALQLTDFRTDDVSVPELRDGEVLVRTLLLSFDPSQKGFMENVASYAAATSLGARQSRRRPGCAHLRRTRNWQINHSFATCSSVE